MNPYDLVIPDSFTFDDVLLLPGYSDFLPGEADLTTQLTPTITLNIPLISAAMDTVTESAMAVALANLGGIGILHRNMSIERQAEEVAKVKNSPPVDTAKAACDEQGRLRVGAAVGVNQLLERAGALLAAGADVIAIDTAHGHSRNVIEGIRELKSNFPGIQVVAGNIATPEAAADLIKVGADALKVGIGPGSICTTRVVAGVGVPQISAIKAVASVAQPAGIPVIADGGIRYSGDIPKAIAAGADVVMLGSLFARSLESPGQEINFNGKPYKVYRGMGSIGALQNDSNDRYGKYTHGPLVPEGIEGMVPVGGSVADLVYQLIGGLTKGMGYCGLGTIQNLKTRARFIRVSPASVRESHPHDVMITKEAPNYARSPN
jgi:IMP dehydrogenase